MKCNMNGGSILILYEFLKTFILSVIIIDIMNHKLRNHAVSSVLPTNYLCIQLTPFLIIQHSGKLTDINVSFDFL